MDKLNLSLRQRKLLHMIQEQTTYITGNELARQLNVSSRTIRSDIVEINQNIKPYQAQILSERHKGYLYSAENPEVIQKLNQIDTAFFTKEDRIRYLAFRLCLADEPLNLFDLEEEMFVSHTTLEHDLHTLKMTYVLSEPYIKLNQKKNYLTFEQNERKRRAVLNHLFHEDWDYNHNWNTYYGYTFLNKDVLDYIMEEIPIHLDKYGISMEDPSLVSLNLAAAIMYHRVLSGHSLPSSAPMSKPDTPAHLAANSIADALEGQLHCSFSQEEREDLYLRIASGHLPTVSEITPENFSLHFGPITLQLVDAYIAKIRDMFHLDFSEDTDFRVTILSYIQFVQTPEHIFNSQGNVDLAKRNLIAEFEIAYLFQDLAQQYFGYYLNQRELLYLAHCISGALEFMFEMHPETKLKTVICCHMNMPAAWALKRKVLGAFEKYLCVTALLPVNGKNIYDFNDTDLVLSTVRKTITKNADIDTIHISPFLEPSDYFSLTEYINQKRLDFLCASSKITFHKLLEQAFWHERETYSDKFTLIEQMATDFIANDLVDVSYLSDLLRRESISTNATGPGILFLHSFVPAKETRLSITTLNHRIMWDSYKIRVVIMATFHPDDMALIFRLLHIFYNDKLDLSTLSMLKTKDELLEFFKEVH